MLPLLATCCSRIRYGTVAMVLVGALAGFRPGTAGAQEHAGFVLDIVGTWQIEGAEPRAIAGGDKLPAGATIVPRPPNPKARIVVCLFTGEAETYTGRTELPKRVEPSLWSRLTRAISGHYRGGIVHAVSRGDQLSDSVLRLSDGQLDVAALLEKLPPGKYLLKFRRVEKSAPKEAAVTLSIDWKPTSAVRAAASTLQPGLYQVELLNHRTRQPTGADAIVFIPAAGKYESDHKNFDLAKTLTQKWDKEVRKVAGPAALRACLESLADPSAEK